jgi:very-short-patch-repair endonuclease
MKKDKWTKIEFERVRYYIRTLNLKSRSKYFDYVKDHLELPKRPDSLEWWISWSDWLGNENRFYGKNEFLSYEDSRDFANKLNISTKKEWEIFYKNENIKNIPRCVDKYYKNKGWISWSDWFCKKSRTDKNYESYENFLEIIIDEKISNSSEYYKFYKEKNLPLNPLEHYGFGKWSQFLFKKNKKRDKLDYNDSKKIVQTLTLKSQKEWYKLSKENKIPDGVPKTPDKYYQDEWISWNDWLGHNVSTYKKFFSYKDAKKFLKGIGLSSLQEYCDYLVENQIDFLPLQPSSYYQSDYISSEDYLSNDGNISYGEKKIEKFLLENNVNYIHQFKFNDCRNIKELIFDFYLPEYNLCLEFDGRQHFEPISFFGGEDGFYKRKINDHIKNDYCLLNGIELVRISYEDINLVEKILSSIIKVGINRIYKKN